MPDNGSIQKRDAHEMAHGRPVQITEHTTVTELQPSLSDVVCANKKLQIGIIVALVVLALLSGFVARPHFADTKTWDSTIEVIDQKKVTYWRSRPCAWRCLRASLRCRAIRERRLPSSSHSFRVTWASCLPCYTSRNICSRFCGRLVWAS